MSAASWNEQEKGLLIRHERFRWRRTWILLVCPLVLGLRGQPQAVIRTNVHVVEVGIVATGAKGAPARGLGARDFRVWDNGKEQAIANFEKAGSPPAAAGGAELPPNTYTNRVAEAASDKSGKPRPQVLSMIVLDSVNTKYRFQTWARRAVEKILDRLDPGQRVAIYAMGSKLRTIHDFSSDKASLLAKLRAYHGEVPNRDDLLEDLDLGTARGVGTPGRKPCVPRTDPETPLELVNLQARILDTLGGLEALANQVKGVPGRKNILWMTGAFPVSVGQLALAGPIIAPSALSGRPSPFQANRNYAVEMKRTMAVLNDAGVSVYPIDARGLSCNPDVNINIGTMRDFADATGGKAFYNRNDLATGVRAALDDSREIYVLTYSPQPMVADGAYHGIRVQTSKRGVQLRYRQGYYAPGKDEAGGAGPPDRLAEAVSSPVDASGIGIQATVEEAGDDIALAIHVDPAGINLVPNAGRWVGALGLEAMQLGAAGERLGGVNQAAKLNLEQATYQRAFEQGLPFKMKFRREPGAIAVRIGVVDERGAHTGSVSVPLPPRP
jgi:VWFA-related protein